MYVCIYMYMCIYVYIYKANSTGAFGYRHNWNAFVGAC